jgi:hypothetical protein
MNKELVENAAQAQGIKLNPGRGEKIAAAIAPLLETAAASNAKLDFDTDATTYPKVLNK